LGSFFFPFDFINLQVHKPASVDLLTSQFTRRLGEIHPDFSSRFFATGARFSTPQARIVRACACEAFSLCAHALSLSISTAPARSMRLCMHCVARI
jgi:hypothetical protein